MLISAADLVPDELAPPARARLARRAAHGIEIGVLGTHARAHFDGEAAALRFAGRYRDLATDTAAPLRSYAVTDGAATRFWIDGGPAFAWPHGRLPPHAVAFLADAVTTHALLAALPAQASLHAAALRRRDAAFALTGLSEAGKTTTAVACLAADCALYSDERCIVRDGAVVAYPRALNLRAGGLALLARDLPPGPLRETLRARPAGDWESVRIAELAGAVAPPEPAPLRALFAIVGTGARPRSRRITPVAMLPLVQPGAHVPARGIDRVRRLLELLGTLACYELVLGSPYATALHLRAQLEAVR